MSAWPSQPQVLGAHRWAESTRANRFSVRRLDRRSALLLACLICALAVQGAAVTQSYLWAAPLIGVLFIAVTADLPLVPFIGATFVVRVITDDLASPNSHHSGTLDLSGLIALMLMLMAVGLILRRRQAVWPTIIATFWLCVWTAIAVTTHGASTETLREGVREASIVALAVIVCNSRGALTVPVVTRIIQVVGLVPGLLALYQFASHTGQLVAGQMRSNATFSHPDGAAMFFAIAATASLWRYIDRGRRHSDALFATLFVTATITTFSIGGLASLLVMLLALGTLRPGSLRLKLGAYAVAVLTTLVFLATPLGAERIAQESSTRLSSGDTRGTANSSLAWRLYKWRTLIPEWERSPLFGQGLGTTVTAEGTSENSTAGRVPHNEYVRYLVETGAFGLALLLWAIAILVRRLSRLRRLRDVSNAPALALAVLIGCLFNALGDNTFLYSNTGYAAALIIAAVLSSSRNRGIISGLLATGSSPVSAQAHVPSSGSA